MSRIFCEKLKTNHDIFRVIALFSSPEPKAHKVSYSIPVEPASVHQCVCVCVWMCVHTFKHEYLCNKQAEFKQILSEASFEWGIDCIRFWTR